MNIETVIRSTLFNIYYVLWTLVLGTLLLPLLAAPHKVVLAGIKLWLRGFIGGAHLIAGIKWRIEGLENLPEGACIVASKHQSAWETFFFHFLVADPVYILKKELLHIPLVGWYMRKTGMLAVDRKAGGAALKYVLRGAEEKLANGRQIIIFPEGTRVAPLAEHPYQPGVAALYARFGSRYPVIPVALNTGMFWGRKSFTKRPGTVVVRILPAMPPGLDKKAFAEELRRRIESATAELCTREDGASAGQTSPA